MVVQHAGDIHAYLWYGRNDFRRIHRRGGAAVHPPPHSRSDSTRLESEPGQRPPKAALAGKSAGYSGTPLLAKLGIKPGARAQFVNPPSDFSETLGPLPAGVSQKARGELDFGVLFVRQSRELAKKFAALRDRLASNGMLWVAWPKKTSGV